MSIPRALNFCEIKFTPATFFGLQAPRPKAYPIYIFARTRAACAQGGIKRRHSRVKKASRTGGRKKMIRLKICCTRLTGLCRTAL